MSDLTPDAIAELKRLEQAATAIPWDRDHFVVFFRASGYEAPETITNEMRQGAVNLSLIESLRNAAPALIAAAEECERLRERVRELECVVMSQFAEIMARREAMAQNGIST